jgi:hypothetical protein
MVTLQAPLPVHAPLHPVKVEFASAVAVNVTVEPELYVAVQTAPQLMPAGELATVPAPGPLLLIVREYTWAGCVGLLTSLE